MSMRGNLESFNIVLQNVETVAGAYQEVQQRSLDEDLAQSLADLKREVEGDLAAGESMPLQNSPAWSWHAENFPTGSHDYLATLTVDSTREIPSY